MYFQHKYFKLRSASSLVAQLAHNQPSLDLVGSNPTSAIKALVAQLVEHLTCNEDVIGSNPIGGSIFRADGKVGELHQTVNLTAYVLSWFESISAHNRPVAQLVRAPH